jgi:15-cis-phytoene desaturase|tara:strand:- start:161 stop:2035 length:1875 start_codon:yes stop_codon:yes gene_type:complete
MVAGTTIGASAASASLASRASESMTARRVAQSRVAPAAASRARALRVVAKDYPKPDKISDTDNYREGAALSQKFKELKGMGKKKKVAIVGGGLSGLACAKYLVDAGHEPIVLEGRDVLGGKVSAWQDKDGDWIETGLHIFFGAYPNMMNLFAELDIEDRLQWKVHKMIFAMQELPGEFTTFDFMKGIPAPLNFGLAILLNQKMLSLPEKLQTAPPLIPMLIEGQDFIDAQDELSVLDFMRKYGMPERINEEVFISMAKALDFIDPDKLSMTVVLTAMNRFLNETDGLQMAFLDGNQPDRLCAPMADHVKAGGGEVRMKARLKEFVLNDDGSVKCLKMTNGEEIVADEYVSAVPVDVMKRLLPKKWSNMPFFHQIQNLEGIPVINIHLWFDRKLQNVDHLCFSRSPLLSVYADMSTTCKEYYDEEKSMLELVFAPCSPLAGGNTNWIAKSNQEIVDATMKELERLFPLEIGPGSPDGVGAKLLKHAVVKTPRSVYAAIPGRNKYRPSQATPISNFTLAGDWTSQKFLGSMEGAVLGGKLAAEVVTDKAIYGGPTKGIKKIVPDVVKEANAMEAREPEGSKGESELSYGAGCVMGEEQEKELAVFDPEQMVTMDNYVARESIPVSR